MYTNFKKRQIDSNRCNNHTIILISGIPRYNISPFDPHRSRYIEQRRGSRSSLGGYKLILKNVSEHGWTNSEVRRFTSDSAHNKIVYEQYFPIKTLEGKFETSNYVLGKLVKNSGDWNLTLSDYRLTYLLFPSPF